MYWSAVRSGKVIYGAVTAVVLLLGAFWFGADWIGAKEYQKGFVAGVADEKTRDEEKMKTLTAKLAAEGLAIQKKESERVRELDRIRDAAREASRVEAAEAAGLASRELDRALARMRAAEAAARVAVRRADSSSRVSEAARKAPGTDGPAACGLLPAGNGEAVLRLSDEADAISRKYRVCLDTAFPKIKPE